jgi:hypothetical protein
LKKTGQDARDMKQPIPLYLVDAFTDQLFRGNPAAVCLLDTPRDAAWMQASTRGGVLGVLLKGTDRVIPSGQAITALSGVLHD